ncbi:MAG: hypothetical protein P8Y10_14480, partial [Gemmatimonadales bacterium]
RTPNANPGTRKTLAKSTELTQKTGDDGHCVVTRSMAEFANRSQSLGLFGGGGGNRTAGGTPGSDDSRTVSRTGIEENTSKEHEQNAFPDILMTMSQIPDVNREFAEVGAMFAVFDVLRRNRRR